MHDNGMTIKRNRMCSMALFFTRGVSLRSWDEAGLFEREVALYRRLQSRGVKVIFITYGDATDLDYRTRIPGISICCNRWNLPDQWYARLIPWLHRKALKTADLVKTNQTYGAEIALAAAQYWHKPLLARCGYMWSDFNVLECGADSLQATHSLSIESKVFHAADGIVVTTSAMRANIETRFSGLGKKITVIPNYVDTDIFAPAITSNNDDRKRLCFVGRLEPQKNIAVLIQAVNDLDVDLDIIGQGVLHDQLRTIAASNPRINFLGTISHTMLPGVLRSCSVFILPSLYEGHPKSLLEAMACGLPVIGTDVPGIKEVVNHGNTGWLCKTDAGSIREAIQTVLSDTTLQQQLGNNASRYISEHNALERIVETELETYHRILGTGRD